MSKKKKPEEDILRSSIETSKIDNAILAAAQNDSDWGGTVGNSGGGGCGGVVSKSNKSIGVSLPSVLRSQKPMATPGRCVYAAVGRQKPMKSSAVTMCEAYSEDIPVIAVELGRKMLGRKALPGWDDINCEGWRAIKLSVHDMGGATGYIVVFGGDFSAKRAQAIVERFALMLGPLLDGQLMDGDAPTIDKASVQAADEARQCSPQAALEMHKTMEPVLMRELQHANGKEKIVEVENQISEVRNIMEKNVELILDRQEQLESLEAKSTELEKGAKQFRKGTRKLRRWHLMNQVKFGVAVGTVISLAVAVPIVLLVAV
eukprot:CAMPEP_0171778160 /NCGR_PEP_ID=MMETSP0991-20121206/58227_1 /TAXON_ID=483369 /ORGANISM="non described non described, Strain CCMP2098" /LENGTH=316 /DNA_ID=CAMNT_0012385043 /DNA_START=183 /DNA_END=1133 /DNA_ORIENTATION=+